MATKKTAAAAETESMEPVMACEEAVAEGPKDPWEEEVEMLVPRKSAGDDQQYYICVNDRRFMVPANGKVQKLPAPIAEVLKNSLEAELAAEEFAERMPHNG